MSAGFPHPYPSAAALAAALVAALAASAPPLSLLVSALTAAALVGLQWLAPGLGARLVDLSGLLALWETLPRRAVDAVLPDPRARRGAVADAGGGRGRIVGQPPERRHPLVATNDRAYPEMCAAFDQDNAALIETRARWSGPPRPPPAALRAALAAAGWLLWLLPLVCLPLGLPPTAGTALVMLLAVPAWGLCGLILFGLLSAIVGLAAWLRAGVLSAWAERDRAQAIRADAARRSSAGALVAQMQRSTVRARSDPGR